MSISMFIDAAVIS